VYTLLVRGVFVFIPLWGLILLATLFLWLLSVAANTPNDEQRDRLERLDRIEKGAVFIDDDGDY
jgi:hypothetical protein